MKPISRSDEEWRRLLTPEQFRVMRRQDTERPFCGAFHDAKEPGLYVCAGCALPLFAAERKFDSGTGWPSFSEPVATEYVATRADDTHGMRRTEILCARCQSHLGHVFADGPPPSGRRHCLNSASLTFVPKSDLVPGASLRAPLERAVFAAGCFWGVEAAFRAVKGVVATTVGYTGGRLVSPTYEDVCTDRTGHAEAVDVLFDPAVVTYAQLVDVFFDHHDPTTPNRQGPDRGTQYRSALFVFDEPQRQAAVAACDRLSRSGRFSAPVVTEIAPAGLFWRAEDYHQQYLEKRGQAACHAPKP